MYELSWLFSVGDLVTPVFVFLHADKAKGIQINLSEALQGKH